MLKRTLTGKWQCAHCGWQTTKPKSKRNCEVQLPNVTTGVGLELEIGFRRWRIKPVPGCSCNSVRRIMDRLGPNGCRTHLLKLAQMIQAEAISRKYHLAHTFLMVLAAKGAILWAVRKVEKNSRRKSLLR